MGEDNKTYSPSVGRNREVILQVLKQYLSKGDRVLEIGSGTGEHAVYFGQELSGLHWVTSDQKENHQKIKEWLKFAALKNVHGPETLKIGVDDITDFSTKPFTHIFTANTLHIMSWKECKSLFKMCGKRLRESSLVIFYGPFNYNGDYTSESNKAFDQSLKERNQKSGIRSFEDVEAAMKKSGFKLLKDHEMPANNRLLVFERLAFN